MIRALIVENEPAVAQHLVELINRNFNDIELVGVYDTVNTSLEGIKKFQPQLVFMDVELHAPETGFDILQKLAHIDFKVIFTTAYNKYAIQAIKFSALDYLLKPINEDELKLAIRKFIAERSVTSNLQRDSLLSYQEGYQDARIGLPGANSYALIPVREIIYCRGESSQSSIFMTGQRHDVISRTLKECEEMLTRFGFCRIHKSYLVNLHHITKYVKGDGGYIMLTNGEHLDVSKSYKEELLEHLHKL